jgi:protease-4
VNKRGTLIAVSIVVGLVLACAILPLGGLWIVTNAASSSTASLTTRATDWQEEIVEGTGPDRVAIITVNGTIASSSGGGDIFSAGQLSAEDWIGQIEQATDDPSVKAVVLRVNSPGGGVVASNEIHGALTDLRAAGKRLVISMGDVAASGGYYIAAAGERIYANADTLTGSLGVIASVQNIEALYDKVGISETVYKSGEFKDIGSASRQPTTEENAIWDALIDQAYNGFVDVIVEGRGLPRPTVLQIADGRIYTGKQALDLKLIDALGNEDDAVAGAKELAGVPNALVVRYTQAPSFGDLFLGAAADIRAGASDPLGVKELLPDPGARLEYMMTP